MARYERLNGSHHRLPQPAESHHAANSAGSESIMGISANENAKEGNGRDYDIYLEQKARKRSASTEYQDLNTRTSKNSPSQLPVTSKYLLELSLFNSNDLPQHITNFNSAGSLTLPELLQPQRSLTSDICTQYYLIMFTFSTIALFVALRFLLLLTSGSSPAGALPAPQYSSNTTTPAAGPSSSTYWVSIIQRQGTVAFNSNASSYKIFRNVKTDCGAAGDGSTDDTQKINTCISAGARCGQGCDSSTVTPALIYFPPGTYLISAPIIQFYYTQFVGDAVSIPTIKGSSSFKGIALIDSDPYADNGVNWYTNQNNFFRQIRNFVIDLTAMPPSTGAGIHWQVAQATSLQNIRFEMVQGGDDNKQEGIFMDNGSGGFMTDLTFNGGNYGAFLGNQQFTTRNMTFNNVKTAIYMNWAWAWTFKSLSINNCGVGIDMSQGGPSQSVGSVLFLDSKLTNTPIGVLTSYGTKQAGSNGTLIIDNVDFTECPVAVSSATSNSTILAGGSVVKSWAQGKEYLSCGNGTATGNNIQDTLTDPPTKPASLLNAQGAVFERSKPQYEQYPASSFLSVKSNGAKGDGSTDDTAAIQAIFNKATKDQIVYFDHGAYIISSTINVPKDIKITGEIWPLIMASGIAFQNEASPVPVFQVGNAGDQGGVEMSDLIFETVGSQPGAILVQWNVADPQGQPGASGMWDVHFRIGGSAGTELQSTECAKNPNVTAAANPKCEAAFLLLHVTQKASIYLENNWFWVADHELDLADHGQINVFNGRGVLIESAQGPVWMYGTSSEHSQLYNYQIANAKNVYMALIQTETPYYQSNPNALTPFAPQANSTWSDPTFSTCTTDACKKSWGLRIVDSSDILMYGGGLYSFFDNYEQTCLDTESCQQNMVSVESSSSVYLFGLSTKASTNMVTVNDAAAVPQEPNQSTFCETIALFEEA
ncbi:MAG: hypothetical protein M1827_003426 [Pycnora praestabilis]|nr:MAG: hypothetical protein M1827_003426 [Pycnora praestabilis]